MKKWYAANKEKQAEYNKKYRAENKERFNEWAREWGMANKEKKAEKNKKYRAENKEKFAELGRKYRLENKQKIADYRRKHYDGEYFKKYLAANRDKINAYKAKYQANRRGRQKHGLMQLNPAQKAEIEGFYQFCKLFAGHEVDHIVPLMGKNVSGLHVPWNLQILTAEQNRSKGNRYTE